MLSALDFPIEKRQEVAREALRTLSSEGGRYKVAARYGISEATVRRWVKRYSEDVQNDHIPPEYLDLKTSRLDIWTVLKLAHDANEVAEGASTGQVEATVQIATNEPIVLVPTGDWHMGSYATDHEDLEDNLQYVFNTPHLYLLDLGDEVDNFTSFRSLAPVLGQSIPPWLQKEWMFEVLVQLVKKGKLLARTWSNHIEGFEERIFGGQAQEFNKICPFLKDDGRLTLIVGSETYRIQAKHIVAGKSIYHVNHGNKRLAYFGWQDADMYISAHTHDGPEHDMFLVDGRPKLALKIPSSKVWDAWSRRYYGRVLPGLQGVVLFPDEHKFVPFKDVEDAVTYRNALASGRYKVV